MMLDKSVGIKHVVITSILCPTAAVSRFSEKNDVKLIVVGDRKTPRQWSHPNVDFLSVDQQSGLRLKTSRHLPYNHYSRKMIGYLYAISIGATCIVDTDDDNIPKAEWGCPEFEGHFEQVAEPRGYLNVYRYFSEQKIWPRGLPLNLVASSFETPFVGAHGSCHVGVWQGLADEDPDVDAVYRLTIDEPCYFREREPLVLFPGTMCPFNSQNTFFRRELFPLLYLPTTVSFRFTDILRGLVTQPIMWLYGYQLGFTHATVVQKRNPHDYMLDFQSELPMYRYSGCVLDMIAGSISESRSLGDNLYAAYHALLANDIVKKHEMTTIAAWLKDLEALAD